MLGDDLDKKVQKYMIELKKSGGKVDTTVVWAAAGMMKKDSRLLGAISLLQKF